MKQLVQEPDSGEVRVVEVPAPIARPGGVLVRTRYSAVSVGTERTQLEFGRKSLLGKALERPDHVRTVLDTVRREGAVSAYRKAKTRLSELSPMGYSCAGVVERVGEGATEFAVGQRVACAGAGYANHAERVWVPRNLAVAVPDGAPLDAAAFATIGAIALQGVRRADARLGESVVVIGLGIVGQLMAQLVRAAGARPIGIDVDGARVALAEWQDVRAVTRSDDVAAAVDAFTAGVGADAVIIAAATSSDDPVRLAGELARDRGRVVVVGAVPIDVPRDVYYEKELELRLSRSYGPGRYDPDYEEKGRDYPIGYVRWTERRNMAEFLRLVAAGDVALEPLVTHRFPFAEAGRAYDSLSGDEGRGALGVVLEYPAEERPEPSRITLRAPASPARRSAGSGSGPVGVGFVGAGNFATGTLLPALDGLGVELRGVVTASGVSARSAAEEHGFAYLAGSPDELFADPDTHAVVVATRHDEHAPLAAAALEAGKAVFVEKPLALDEESLDDVLDAAAAVSAPLMVGFNRRFAPATVFVRERLAGAAGARVVHVRVNAGAVPAEHWIHDPEIGGGRLIGEGCHFVDLALHLIGSPPVEVRALRVGGDDPAAALADNFQIGLRCADGSIADIIYTSKGDPGMGKERVEVFAGGATGVIDDFRRARVGTGRRDRWKGRPDKGHAAELEAFVRAVREGGEPPIPLAELEASSRATLRAAAALRRGEPAALE